MSTRPRPIVGDVLWLAYTEPRDAGREHAIVVTKVGRRWATACRGTEWPRQGSRHVELRFDFTDPRWFVDAGMLASSARVWPSRSAWQDDVLRDQALQALRMAIENGRALPPETTFADVLEAARVLGVSDRMPAAVHALRSDAAGGAT